MFLTSEAADSQKEAMKTTTSARQCAVDAVEQAYPKRDDQRTEDDRFRRLRFVARMPAMPSELTGRG
jgi:hypothetical protein